MRFAYLLFLFAILIILWKVVPLPNLQVASMRRELEAEQPGIRYSTEAFQTSSQKKHVWSYDLFAIDVNSIDLS